MKSDGNGTESKVYFHVAGASYRAGDWLYSFEQLVGRGEASVEEWRWEQRPYGDGSESRIFLFEGLDEATEFAACYGGTVLQLADLEDVRRDEIEGYATVAGPIPPDCIEAVV